MVYMNGEKVKKMSGKNKRFQWENVCVYDGLCAREKTAFVKV